MVKATCGVDGCERVQKARGYCSKHYIRLWKHGDPLADFAPPMVSEGQIFGGLTVVSTSRPRYLCRCECGEERVVGGYYLTRGITTHCGCSSRALKHGHASGGKPSPTYNSWRAAVKRTTDPKHEAWPNYGGRGIAMCERWLDFSNFLEDMGERPEGATLDRINPDGNYEPINCRWAGAFVQARNKRDDELLVWWSE